MSALTTGTIGWMDLTIPNAESVRRFYESVVGWHAVGVEMGGYQDYAMGPKGSERAVAGICHARGVNTGLPPCWLIYITVNDLDAATAAARRGGGEIVSDTRQAGGGRYCVVQDPAGAHFALFESPAAAPAKPARTKSPKPKRPKKKAASKPPSRAAPKKKPAAGRAARARRRTR